MARPRKVAAEPVALPKVESPEAPVVEAYIEPAAPEPTSLTFAVTPTLACLQQMRIRHIAANQAGDVQSAEPLHAVLIAVDDLRNAINRELPKADAAVTELLLSLRSYL